MVVMFEFAKHKIIYLHYITEVKSALENLFGIQPKGFFHTSGTVLHQFEMGPMRDTVARENIGEGVCNTIHTIS